MAKVSGAYDSVVRGVSEQAPQNRRPGQNFEQVNMISDPVLGLARRHGSLMMDETIIATYDDTSYAALLASTAQHRAFSFFVDGIEYDLICRRDASGTPLRSNFGFAYNKVSGKFIPVVLNSSDTVIDALVAGGVSATVNVGKYVFLGGNTITPDYTFHDTWGATSNQELIVAWVRGGAYSRTYKITLTKTDGTTLVASYTTMASSYPTLLDTSDIPATAVDYQKQVNDRVNAYNSAVTQYIGLAAADVVPANIATRLEAALIAAGVPSGNVSVVDSTVTLNSASYVEIICDDGGDGSLFRGVGNTIINVDAVSAKHWPGKIVKVRPTKNDETDTLYIKATARDGLTTTWTDVTWIEGAGYEMTPVSPFCIATVSAETLYIAGSPAGLTALVGEDVPVFKTNGVGDQITCPLPSFIGRTVDFLGLHQDRLIIGTGATLFFSKPGDYFNWFRGSVLTVADNDPVEIYALSAQDDTIKAATVFDKDVILFGKRKQYSLDGQSIFKPSTAAITPMLANENAVDAAPQDSGNFVFYAQTRNGATSMHQIQAGQLLYNPESFDISQQLDRYLLGHPLEIVTVTSPNMVLLRTDADRNQVFTYSYLDTATGQQRLFDSWSKWTWDASLGSVMGISKYLEDVLIYTIRHGVDKDNNSKVWVAADKFVVDSRLSDYPYVDSLRPTSSVLTPAANSFINPNSMLDDVAWVAFGTNAGDMQFLGTNMDNLPLFLEQYTTAPDVSYSGIAFPAYATPTNPYIRDADGKAITTGRLTLGRLSITIANSGGFRVDVTTPNLTYIPTNFTGRLSGRSSNLVGKQPILSTAIGALVGREIRECSYTISAQTFLPLTVTAIEWAGQLFNNVQRVTS